MRKICIFILSILISQPSFGALAFVNCKGAGSAGSSVSTLQSGAISATAGNAVYIYAVFKAACGASTLTVSDLDSDTFTAIGSKVANASGAMCSYMWYCKNLVGNASEKYTVNWTGGGSAPLSFSVIQFSGQDTSSPFDQTATPGFGNVATTATTGTWTTTSANEIMVTGMGSYALSRTWTGDTGWTLDSTCLAPSDQNATIQYKIVSSTQTGISTVVTISGAGTYIDALVATFKQASGGSTFVANPSVFGIGVQ